MGPFWQFKNRYGWHIFLDLPKNIVYKTIVFPISTPHDYSLNFWVLLQHQNGVNHCMQLCRQPRKPGSLPPHGAAEVTTLAARLL